MNPDTVARYRCVECGAVMEEACKEPLYECGECFTLFVRENSADGVSNRCLYCDKFARKLSDTSCPECKEGELERVELYACGICGRLYDDRNQAEECCDN